MRMQDMILVSVDDHIVEPPDMFRHHVPAKYADRAPRMVKLEDGTDVWSFDGKIAPNVALNAVAGRHPEEYGLEPTTLAELRKGCYDVKARIDDMNAGGYLGSLNFPSFIGCQGHLFKNCADKDLALAILMAYNDWHIDEWCGAYPGRFIPCAVVPLWDPQLAAAEVRRVNRKGCHAVSFLPNPTREGLPSIHTGHWDPYFAACAELGVVNCLHISDAANAIPSPDSPVDVFIAGMPVTLYATAADLVFSPVLRKFKDIRFALSEGGCGWVPFFLERIDYVHKHHVWTRQDFGGKLPSQVFLEHVYTCFIDDRTGVRNRAFGGLDNMTWECDYPHSDSTWPRAAEILWESLEGLSDAEIDKITHLNAMKCYSYDPFRHIRREDCTVGALRAQAAHVDLSYTDTGGKGRKPTDASLGPIPMAEITRQLNAALSLNLATK
ncbi:MAG: amidohydrolase family protein [Gammaproteobacteria bacterium]